MFKMILADDEPVITRGIECLADWKALGIEIVSTHSNGEAAFNAIIESGADIAVLDISMPKKTGVDILRDLSKIGAKTKVIFLSGFQDFKYAHSAIKYGAVDYLLKPVKKDELLNAISKCMNKQNVAPNLSVSSKEKLSPLGENVCKKLVKMQTNKYLLVLYELTSSNKEDKLAEEFIKFTASAEIENYLQENEFGAAFVYKKQCCLAFKLTQENELVNILNALNEMVNEQCNLTAMFTVCSTNLNLTQIPSAVSRCMVFKEYFYFYPMAVSNIIFENECLKQERYDVSELLCIRDVIIEKIIAQDENALNEAVNKYLKLAAFASQGSKQAAAYFAISCLRYVDNELKKKFLLEDLTVQENELLEVLSNTFSYQGLQEIVLDKIKSMYNIVLQNTQNSAKKDALKAMEYIKEHYHENLSLEILAKQIHMNSFYFSSFFKKHTGENFKDYLNEYV